MCIAGRLAEVERRTFGRRLSFFSSFGGGGGFSADVEILSLKMIFESNKLVNRGEWLKTNDLFALR